MQITSPQFIHNASIPAKYTCDGDDKNPQLLFSDVPANTKSFVLIVDDPDVPKSIRPDGVWDHWLVWNIPGSATQIAEATEPPGIVGRNTSGTYNYVGPCPPDAEHRYFFKLYALDTTLPLDTSATKQQLEQAMTGHILAQAELVGRYNRQ